MLPRSVAEATEASPARSADALAGFALVRHKLADYLLLTRARLAFLVLVTGLTSFWLASGVSLDATRLLWFGLGTFLLIGGANAFNQIAERDRDRLMTRTARRPIPAGRMSLSEAWSAALALSLSGLALLLFSTNRLTALLGASALSIYLFAYTPLKPRSDWSTLVGAISGAIPPLMGWSAVRGEIAPAALILFAVLFFWQFPHTWAIAAYYREDFMRVGYRVLPLSDPSGRRTRRQGLVCGLGLVLASFLPAWLGKAGSGYVVAALLLDLALLFYLARFVRDRSRATGGRLLAFSLVYLPLLLAFLVLDGRRP